MVIAKAVRRSRRADPFEFRIAGPGLLVGGNCKGELTQRHEVVQKEFHWF
jgi:hypothetical protein